MAQNDTELSREELYETLYELRKENKNLKRTKKFGLVFEQKPDAQVMRVRNEIPVLREDTERAVVTDESDVNHLLINGDNFHALTALRATHANRVDVIYIDPPYNTGNKDFIYNDNYLDKEDGYRHSKWLSFMDKRLRLAHELLSETGVIFVSIDDNEQARLKLLMDDVFEPDNFVSTLTWKNKSQPINSGSARFKTQHNIEYVLTYAKNVDFLPLLNLASGGKRTYPDKGQYGPCRFEGIEDSDSGRKNRESMKFPILGVPPRDGRRWKIGKEKADELVSLGRIELVNGVPKIAVYPDNDSVKLFPFWSHLENVSTAQKGKSELGSIIKDSGFDTVKPLDLLKVLFTTFSSRDSIVLDFFAGSGTTAHAVAELNKEDGGRRQCILVTDGGKTEESGESSKNAKGDEVNIAEEITYERVRRVLTGKDWADGKEHEPLGGNLRYFNVELHDIQGATKLDKMQKLEDVTPSHASVAENAFTVVEEKDEFDEELYLYQTYKVFTAPAAEGEGVRYVVGVARHDYELADLEQYVKALPEGSDITLVGNGLSKIAWVKENLATLKVIDVMDSVIESHRWVTTTLCHDR